MDTRIDTPTTGTGRLHLLLLSASALVALVAPYAASAESLGFSPNSSWRSSPGTVFFSDAVTGDNQFASSASAGERRWTIDLGADVYEQELYERPTIQSLDPGDTRGTQRAYKTYYEFLDITRAARGLDAQNEVAYFGIELYGRNEVNQDGVATEKGFTERYRVRISDNAEFTGGHLLGVEDPESKRSRGWQNETTRAWVDADGDIQASVPNQGTNGYDDEFMNTQDANLAARISGNWVELALDYGALGWDPSKFTFLIFESTKGLTDPQNYFWNDEYSFSQAGSPYTNMGVGNVQNIYELDTLRELGEIPPPIPLPGTLPLLGTGLALLGWLGRRTRSTAVSA